jgi:hypothetical protein
MNNQSDCFTGISQHEKRDVAMELAWVSGKSVLIHTPVWISFQHILSLGLPITHNIGKIKY